MDELLERWIEDIFFDLFMYFIQHRRPSDSTVSADARIEPRTVAIPALADRRSNHSARSHPHYTVEDIEQKNIRCEMLGLLVGNTLVML